MRIVTSKEMKSLDQRAISEIGFSGLQLMENAGLSNAQLIADIMKDQDPNTEIIVFCGRGKNGGDGMVIARRLIADGYRVRIFLMHLIKDYDGECAAELKILQNLKAKITTIDSSQIVKEFFENAKPPFIIVDALLGIGLDRPIEGLYFDVIELINQSVDQNLTSKNVVVSVDVPSGVMSDTGKIAGTCVQAHYTVTFGYPKLGLFVPPGAAKRGELYLADLCFPKEWDKEGDKYLLDSDHVAPLIQKRDKYGHKNSFGHSLLIGGSPGKLGAICMASQSCLKVGTGLVTVASWDESFPSLETKLADEIMNFRIKKDSNDFIVPKHALNMFTSVVVGPGLGSEKDTEQLMRKLLSDYAGPLVIDADGLNCIADFQMHDFLSKRPGPTVITPHPGEMARLLGISKEEVIDNPIAAVQNAFEKTGAISILKGATTFIFGNDNISWINHYPNDGMATAGSGDVLAGIIGGLLGQKMNPLEAAKLGVRVHSLAGKYAALDSGHRSMTSIDIINNLKNAFRELQEYKPKGISYLCEKII